VTLQDLTFSFSRYLEAKKSVDDRALNRLTWDALGKELTAARFPGPLRVLEVGAGIGTMLQRMVEWELISNAEYTAIDLDPQNISSAHQRLAAWADNGSPTPQGFTLEKGDSRVSVEMEAIDLFEFARREAGNRTWDLLVAHAVMDLLDIPSALPPLFSLLAGGGFFYFTINFDGLTVLEPALDSELDELIIRLYHNSMDMRCFDGALSGDSRTGRHLFTHLYRLGAQVLQAGASDWVVFPIEGAYPADEAYFLHFIIHTIQIALTDHPELEAGILAEWIASRHAQVEHGELVYIAHQIDVFGRYPGLNERTST
jgi:SAM-dependent methyltransferase